MILVKTCAAGVEIPIGRFTKVRENSSIEKTNTSRKVFTCSQSKNSLALAPLFLSSL